MTWGFHGIYNVFRCCPVAIRTPATILRFNTDLVRRIDMKAYGEPFLQRFGPNDKVLGYTLVQLIETSNITMHCVEETNDLYLDVFSCKVFQNEIVKDCIRDHFNPICIEDLYISRQAKDVLS